jgi:carbon-monoxide dehydrogenase medium subunit
MNVTSPSSLRAVHDALAGATERTRMVAGGTDLLVEMQSGRSLPDAVIDLWSVDELRGIRALDGWLEIGALTTCTELCRDARVPDILAAAAHEVGAAQIRNRATLGGNLGTASPAADLTPVLFALDARVRSAHATGAARCR